MIQYLSQLASGEAPRLKILWARSYSSWADFCEHEPRALRVFRIFLESTVSWLTYRLINGSMSPPWLWAGVIDFRRTAVERASIKDQLFAMDVELTDSWFHDTMIEALDERSDMDDQYFEFGLWLWSWTVLTTNAQCEYKNGRDQHHSNMHTSWANVVAHCGNASAMHKIRQDHKAAFPHL